MRSSGTESARRPERAGGRWTRAVRGPWVVVCAVTAVVLGPAAVTASALDQANAAPPRSTARAAERPQACLPTDPGRRRTAP
ncbi:hypothetical protein AB0912_35595 [Streptomyces sp. NPDC007084]|uniref:hypothetical protein n=1 Tax=Streptomyces sp. NPDC007084 TaxID=3154313 RepID=UPI0034515871